MKEVAAFFALTCAVSWPLFIAAAAVGPAPVNGPLYIVGVFAPSLVALALTALVGGGAATRELLRRVVAPPPGVRWYVFAIGYMAAIKIAAAALHRIAFGAWPRFGQEPPYVLALAILLSTPVQAGEEIGWRGYALPRLATRFGLGPASIVVGIVWARSLPGPGNCAHWPRGQLWQV